MIHRAPGYRLRRTRFSATMLQIRDSQTSELWRSTFSTTHASNRCRAPFGPSMLGSAFLIVAATILSRRTLQCRLVLHRSGPAACPGTSWSAFSPLPLHSGSPVPPAWSCNSLRWQRPRTCVQHFWASFHRINHSFSRVRFPSRLTFF